MTCEVYFVAQESDYTLGVRKCRLFIGKEDLVQELRRLLQKHVLEE